MFTGRIYSLVKGYLQEYMFGFDEKQLETNFWSGDINLKNLNLRPDKITELLGEDAPYGLKAGLISNLKVKVENSSLLKSSRLISSATQFSLKSRICSSFWVPVSRTATTKKM